jgi:hypothetical protein
MTANMASMAYFERLAKLKQIGFSLVHFGLDHGLFALF